MSQVNATTTIPPELITRLAQIFENYELEELVSACEEIRRLGGWGVVSFEYKNHDVTDLDFHVHRKPKRDQSNLFR